jgi:hypothetical protein
MATSKAANAHGVSMVCEACAWRSQWIDAAGFNAVAKDDRSREANP